MIYLMFETKLDININILKDNHLVDELEEESENNKIQLRYL